MSLAIVALPKAIQWNLETIAKQSGSILSWTPIADPAAHKARSKAPASSPAGPAVPYRAKICRS